MRKIYLTLLLTGILFALGAPLKAQVSLSLNFNIGSQPAWGPVGYDEVQYYYLPDIDSYYYVPQHRFYFYNGRNWIYSSSLPPRYAHYNLYNGYKVVVNEREPWRNHNSYKAKYSSFKGRHDQKMIRDSRDSKYFENRNHPEHNNWIKQQKHDNGNDKGQNRSNKDDNKKKSEHRKHKK
ncbi:MAG: hypothetical protein COZ80_10685 [Ignavibacteria bacterium CG_4_8_14_3_um_filter_37_9]|nr:MAG: hypothetical protein COZ80_10685 [Ignavibacteria bacterium CG_4_8_14_3_um_filter_37_9]PIX94860.1 MAG: hypothetical protein COZ25_03400 [Ignavibacteria bacterium CG_4_10_14_3_um_filter_37_18]